MSLITIKNRRSKAEKQVTKEGFDAIQKNPLTADLWYQVEGMRIPPEVKSLADKQADKATEKAYEKVK